MSEKKKIELQIGYGVVQTFKNGHTIFYDEFFEWKSNAVKWAVSMWKYGEDKTWRQIKRRYNLRIVKVKMEVIDE